jgi:hypothetical protein
MPIDLDAIVSESNLDLEFRELSLKTLELDDDVTFGLEVFSPSGKIFSVDSVLGTITGTTSDITGIVSGKKLYLPIEIKSLGWNYITVEANVGSEKFVFQKKVWVD